MASVGVRLNAQLGAEFWAVVLHFIVEQALVIGELFILDASHDCSAGTIELARFEAHLRTSGSAQPSLDRMALGYG